MVLIKTYSWNKWWQWNGKDFTWSMPTLFSLAFMHSTFTCMKKKSQKDGIVHLNMISKCNQQGIESFETWRGRLLWLWAYSRCLRASSRCSVSSWHRSSWRNNFCNWPMCNGNYSKKELLQKRKPNFNLRAEFLPPLPNVTDPVSKSAGNLKGFSYRWPFYHS